MEPNLQPSPQPTNSGSQDSLDVSKTNELNQAAAKKVTAISSTSDQSIIRSHIAPRRNKKVIGIVGILVLLLLAVGFGLVYHYFLSK